MILTEARPNFCWIAALPYQSAGIFKKRPRWNLAQWILESVTSTQEKCSAGFGKTTI